MDARTSGEIEEMRFDKADYAEQEAPALACRFCESSIRDRYYEVNGATACGPCREIQEEARSAGGGAGRFLRSLLAGTLAAAAGTLLWYLVAEITGYELGLLALVVGVMVGYAVRWGSRGRGGWLYQTVAMVLTYLSIVSSYVPQIVSEFQQMSLTESAPVGEGIAASEVPAHEFTATEQGLQSATTEGGRPLSPKAR